MVMDTQFLVKLFVRIKPKNITFDEALKGGKVTEEKRNIFCSENEMNGNKNDVHVTVGDSLGRMASFSHCNIVVRHSGTLFFQSLHAANFREC
jgi:hypothetical protein